MEFVNGKDDIPYMKWKIKFMFETTNQVQIGFDLTPYGPYAWDYWIFLPPAPSHGPDDQSHKFRSRRNRSLTGRVRARLTFVSSVKSGMNWMLKNLSFGKFGF
jgi:hypothetical protein